MSRSFLVVNRSAVRLDRSLESEKSGLAEFATEQSGIVVQNS